MSDYTTTPNLGLLKPTPNADADLWGDHLNQNADTLDALLWPIGNAISVPPGGSIQAAHDALPATGGSILLAANTIYDATTTVTISKNNVRLTGPSWSTIVRRNPSYTASVLINVTGSGCTVEGFTVDGNSVVTTVGEVATSGDKSLVQRMQIINSMGTAHLSLAGNNSRATGNTITGLGNDNTVQTGYGIWALNHQTVMIDHNTVSGTCIDGIGVDGTGSQVIGNRVFGCHCYTHGGGGQIVTYPLSSDPLGGTGVSIIGNTIGPGGATTADGIEVGGINGLITGNFIDSVQAYGILVISSGATITGNTLRNTPFSANIDAIVVQPNVTDFVITGNHMFDDRTTPMMRSGVWVNTGTSDRYTIVGNTALPYTLAGVVDNGTGNIKTIGLNAGSDTRIPTIASAATVAFPAAAVIKLSGSVTITAIDSTIGQATGRSLTIIPTGSAQFVGGAGGIANSVTCVPNNPLRATFDGTSWYISPGGLPLSGGTLTGPLTVTGQIKATTELITAFAGTAPPTLGGSVHDLVSTGSSNLRQSMTAAGSNLLSFRSSAGTLGVPTPTAANQVIGGLQAMGYAPTAGWGTTPLGAIQFASGGLWSDTSQPTFINFLTAPVNGTAQVEAMRISPSGNLLLGTVTDGTNKLDVVGAARFNGSLGFNNTTPVAKPTVAGACAGNTAIKALLTALAAYGLVTDSTTA
jgi:nitrous oxidase accessory protein NosD